MLDKTPPEIASNQAWLVNDERWMKARLRAWARVESWLKRRSYSANELRQLHSYFVFGRMAGSTRWQSRYLPSIPLFFRLWLHPDASDENWATQARFTTWEDFEASMIAFRYASYAVPRPYGDELEHRLFETLLGGEPVRSFLDAGKYSYGVREWTSRSTAVYFAHADGLALELSQALTSNVVARPAIRLSMHQFVKYGVEPAWAEIFRKKDRTARITKLFDLVAAIVAGAAARASKEGAAAPRVELARDLAELFDSGKGPARFQSLWRSRKAAAKPGSSRAPAAAAKRDKKVTPKPKAKTSARKASKAKVRGTRKTSSSRR